MALDAFLEAHRMPASPVCRLKALSCLHEVSDVQHRKKNHASAPVTCRVLCAISYLQSMQQQRLDEKLILPPSLCLSLSIPLTVYISVQHGVCVFLLCPRQKSPFVHLYMLMVHSPSSRNSGWEITPVQVSCQM